MNMNDAKILRQNQIADGLRRCYGLFDGAVPAGMNFDASEAIAFLTSQLAHVETTVYEKQRQPMQYQRLVPISTEAGEYATSIEFQTYDYAGRGKKHSGRAGDVSKVDVAYGQKSIPISHGAIGYDYSQQELRESSFLRRPLNVTRAAAAMEAYERHINGVMLTGETESNFTGLFNNANVPQGNVAAGVGGVTWALKTPLEILKDINDAFTAIWTTTQFNDIGDTVAISPAQYAYIATTPLSATFPNKTILQYLKENCLPKVERGVDVDFVPGYGLAGAGAGGTNRFMIYTKNPTRLKGHLPMPLRFLAPQMEGLMVEIPGEYRYSGVTFYYPKSALYRDGI